MIVCDTGPLVAAALSDDVNHHASVEVFTGLHLAQRRILVPATVSAEVGYLLERQAGPKTEAGFLESLADGDFEAVDLTPSDYARNGRAGPQVRGSAVGNHRCFCDRGRGAVGDRYRQGCPVAGLRPESRQEAAQFGAKSFHSFLVRLGCHRVLGLIRVVATSGR